MTSRSPESHPEGAPAPADQPEAEVSMRDHRTAPEDRVPVPQKAAFGTGMITYSLMVNGYMQMVNPIFNVNLGMSPVMIGWVMAIARVWDAVTDPFMANVSDNTRSRWGRRRPWILLGSIIGALLFVLVWWFPEGRSTTFYFWWLLGTTLLFYMGFTLFSVPYIALGMEMSPDYHERTRIVAWRSFLGPVGAFAAQALYWFATLSFFASPIVGMRWTAVGVAVVIMVLGAVAAIFPREHPGAKAAISKQAKTPLFKSARQTLSIRSYRIVCGITLISLLSVLLVNHLGFYINLYYVYAGDQSASAAVFAFAGLSYQIGAIVAVPLITMYSTRHGKRKALIFFLSLAIAGSLLKWWCYTPALPYLQLLPNFLMGFGYAVNGLITNAMLPENCDYDELQTGTRREGMFGAVYSWIFKLGAAVAMVGGGYVLVVTGFDANVGGAQPATTLYWMRILFTAVPVLGLLIAIYLAWLYPITEEKAYQMQNELKKRHAVAHADAASASQTTL